MRQNQWQEEPAAEQGMQTRSVFYAENETMNDAPPETETFVTLYRRAFADYGTRALWNMRPIEHPTPADALAITRALRTHGGMEGRRLAEQIESVCRAPH